jgi:Amt family ammonium transporter
VLLMTPALAFFYGGLVRSKNALNTMMMSFISLGFVGMLWAVIGYTLALTPGNNWIGDLSLVALRGVGVEPTGAIAALTIPHMLYMAFQGTFCIITAALISGAIVERMRFSAYVAFISLWSVIVYAPLAHWVWGGGWLADMGALDFAGGTVVHINAAAAALVAALGQADRRGRRDGDCRRPRRGDPGGGLHRPDERAGPRHDRRRAELPGAAVARQDVAR